MAEGSSRLAMGVRGTIVRVCLNGMLVLEPISSSVQCTSHATVFLLYINIWLYIQIFDYTYQWICGLDDSQMLACGSLSSDF